MGFLQHYGLDKEFALNIECNHATLAGHSCDHELQVHETHYSHSVGLGTMPASSCHPSFDASGR